MNLQYIFLNDPAISGFDPSQLWQKNSKDDLSSVELQLVSVEFSILKSWNAKMPF